VRRGAYVVVVYLSGRPFHRVVVEVADPQRTHRGIEAALLHSKTTGLRQSYRGLLPGPGEDGAGTTGRGHR
jgi:hypothetical protein